MDCACLCRQLNELLIMTSVEPDSRSAYTGCATCCAFHRAGVKPQAAGLCNPFGITRFPYTIFNLHRSTMFLQSASHDHITGLILNTPRLLKCSLRAQCVLNQIRLVSMTAPRTARFATRHQTADVMKLMPLHLTAQPAFLPKNNTWTMFRGGKRWFMLNFVVIEQELREKP